VLDALAPAGALGRGTIHELLYAPEHGEPRFFATVLAQHASAGQKQRRLPVIWSDPRGELYPPAVASMGIDLRRLYLLRPRSAAEETWAVAECLRCKGVGAVVAAPQTLSRVEARRLQLAAETGGGVGLLLRPAGKRSIHYAATTRWLVAPALGERSVQRWRIQLLHGHGGRVGETVFLECDRETHSVRATTQLADRTVATATASARRATA
jgi:protein ImuA